MKRRAFLGASAALAIPQAFAQLLDFRTMDRATGVLGRRSRASRFSDDYIDILDHCTTEGQRRAMRLGTVELNTAYDNAVAEAVERRNRPILIPGGAYESGRDFRLNNPGLLIRGEKGLTRIKKNGLNSLFRTLGTRPVLTGGRFASDMAVNDMAATLDTGLAAPFAVNQIVIKTDEATIGGASGQTGRNGEFAQIQDIAGDVVNFWSPSKLAYAAGDGASQFARIIPVSLTGGVAYLDLIADMDDTIALVNSNGFQEAFAFDMRFCLEPSVDDCAVKNCLMAGIFFTGCLGHRVSRYRAKDFGSSTTGTGDPASTEGTPGTGYSIREDALNQGLIADQLYVRRNRHGYTTTSGYPDWIGSADGWNYGWPYGSLISNATHEDARESGWDTHAAGSDITFDNCWTIGGRRGGMQVRARRTKVRGGGANNCRGPAIWARGGASGSTHGDEADVDGYQSDNTNLYDDGSLDWRELGAICDEAHYSRFSNITVKRCGGPALTIGRNGVARGNVYTNFEAIDPGLLASAKRHMVDLVNGNSNANLLIDGIVLQDTGGKITDVIKRNTATIVFHVTPRIRAYGHTGKLVNSITSFAGMTFGDLDAPKGQPLTGSSFSTWGGPVATTAAIPAVDIIYFYPFQLLQPFMFTAGEARTVTAGASSSIKVGIWANSALSDRPFGAPLTADNIGVTTQSNGQTRRPAISATLDPGWYWIGVKATGTLPRMVSLPFAHQHLSWAMGAPTMTTNALSFADAYANNMPTMPEKTSFSSVAVSGVPIVALVSA